MWPIQNNSFQLTWLLLLCWWFSNGLLLLLKISTMKQTIQIIAKQYRTVDNRRVHAKRDHDTLFKILPGMASDCDKHLYVCIPARLLMPHYPRLHYFFDMPVLKWFTFDLLFSPTHTWWHMDAIFSQNSHAAQLPAAGRYPCYGKVVCGFMNAFVPHLPSKTKRL